MTTRKAQAANTKRAILHALERLLQQKDYQKITIAEIAKEAGVSVGLVYYHFTSKDDILLFDYGEFDKKVRNILSKKYYDNNLDAIRELIFQQTHRADYAGRLAMAQSYRVQLNQKTKMAFEPERGFHVYLRGLLEKALAAGELRGSAQEVMETILRVVRGALFDWSMREDEKLAYENAMHDLERVFISFGMPPSKIADYPVEEWDEMTKYMLHRDE